MNAIYKQARFIIVTLKDIAINEAKEVFLKDLINKYN